MSKFAPPEIDWSLKAETIFKLKPYLLAPPKTLEKRNPHLLVPIRDLIPDRIKLELLGMAQ